VSATTSPAVPSTRAVSGSGVNSSDHAVNALDTSSDTPVIISPPSSAAAGTIACASGSPPDSRSSTRRSPVANQSSSAIPAPSTGSPMPAAAWLAANDRGGEHEHEERPERVQPARPAVGFGERDLRRAEQRHQQRKAEVGAREPRDERDEEEQHLEGMDAEADGGMRVEGIAAGAEDVGADQVDLQEDAERDR
jgi:hypothetical protein